MLFSPISSDKFPCLADAGLKCFAIVKQLTINNDE
jgi:hypothetical protein